VNSNSIVVQQGSKRPDQLILLFHGVGATPDYMVPLGHRLAGEFRQATVVSIAARFPSDMSWGHQWFSVQDVTEDNRPERVAAAMPEFLAEVHAWQKNEDATAATTILVGFSQGAIMALEAACTFPALAGQVVAIAGRFARLPAKTAPQTALHLLHGEQDVVIPYRYTVEAEHHLLGIGSDVTVDLLPSIGHEIDAEIMNRIVERLKGPAPKSLWE